MSRYSWLALTGSVLTLAGSLVAAPQVNAQVRDLSVPTVMVVAADGTGARAIAPGYDPDWAADGSTIAFAQGKDVGNPDGVFGGALFTVPADGSRPARQLSPDLQ